MFIDALLLLKSNSVSIEFPFTKHSSFFSHSVSHALWQILGLSGFTDFFVFLINCLTWASWFHRFFIFPFYIIFIHLSAFWNIIWTPGALLVSIGVFNTVTLFNSKLILWILTTFSISVQIFLWAVASWHILIFVFFLDMW